MIVKANDTKRIAIAIVVVARDFDPPPSAASIAQPGDPTTDKHSSNGP
jgi:hypothetical protein